MAAEANTYGLPTGENVRRALVRLFREQRANLIAALTPPKQKSAEQLPELPNQLPDIRPGLHDFIDVMTPLITAYWDKAGQTFFAKHDLDPEKWQVVNPHTKAMIEQSVLAFSESTLKTTNLALDEALKRTREELVAGVVTRGESIEQLTDRIQSVFTAAETWRARRIAQTETSRAVHGANEAAALQWGGVAGWEWLLSSDACPMCQTIGRRAKFVRLGQAFAVIGSNPAYAEVKYPPAHPHCNCTVVEVLTEDDSKTPWSATLHQPKPEAQDYPDGQLPGTRPKPEPKPKPAPKPKPKPKPPAKPTTKPQEPHKTIQERLASYTEGDAKVAALAKIQSDVDAAQARQETALAAWKATEHFNQLPRDKWTEEMRTQRRNLSAALMNAQNELNRVRDSVRDRAMEVLLVPPKQRMKIISPQKGKPMSKLPEPLRGEAEKGLEWFGQVLAKGPGPALLVAQGKLVPKNSDDRANATYQQIFLEPHNKSHIVVHEMGHCLEFQHAKESAHAFLKHRVGDEKPAKLKELFPEKGYKDNEFGRKDEFTRSMSLHYAYYTGKDYGTYATEVLSMGVQKLYEDPHGFAAKDPEYCKFILGILDGSLR
ncbi:MAG TPA: hypothetical protein VN719_09690 [Gemmatimonadales bacterium]|nr:hypothetical protein [Gemmatimonadales bacterium]